jgi:tRNA modification GTPase
MDNKNDTVCALATPGISSAISVIRVSGSKAISIVDSIFTPLSGPSLMAGKSRTMRLGTIKKGNSVIDEVLVALFNSPASYTGEDSAEIFCHGSTYIQKEILMLLFASGARQAAPGEFSMRAFLNGKMDLAQAEAVADLISSETSAAHRIAMQQMKGGFSRKLSEMRSELLNLVSLMELELDFSEEDVEFADRTRLRIMLDGVRTHIETLIDSFKLGNVIKNGVPVAIVGATNTGKSTLLNSILGEERAIVSDIHGTTRDFIEDVVNIDGTAFRFIDTAGIRKTDETIELIGIERTYEKIRKASVVMLMLDSEKEDSFRESIMKIADSPAFSDQILFILVNKTDSIEGGKAEMDRLCSVAHSLSLESGLNPYVVMGISAKSDKGLKELKKALVSGQNLNFSGSDDLLVSNVRHHQALLLALEALNRVEDGMDNSIPTDLLTQDIRDALFHLGEIVGEINTEEILGNIFSKFCIGK